MRGYAKLSILLAPFLVMEGFTAGREKDPGADQGQVGEHNSGYPSTVRNKGVTMKKFILLVPL
jgi:hypothetical protein